MRPPPFPGDALMRKSKRKKARTAAIRNAWRGKDAVDTNRSSTRRGSEQHKGEHSSAVREVMLGEEQRYIVEEKEGTYRIAVAWRRMVGCRKAKKRSTARYRSTHRLLRECLAAQHAASSEGRLAQRFAPHRRPFTLSTTFHAVHPSSPPRHAGSAPRAFELFIVFFAARQSRRPRRHISAPPPPPSPRQYRQAAATCRFSPGITICR